MSKKEKAIEKLRQNPKNVRFEELDTILQTLGFTKRQNGTSHAVYSFPGFLPITVPTRQPFLLYCYVKEALNRIDEILASIEEKDSR